MTAKIFTFNDHFCNRLELKLTEYISKEVSQNPCLEGYEIEEMVNEFLQNNAPKFPRCNRKKIGVSFSSTDGMPYLRITKDYATEFSMYILMTIIFKNEL